MLKGRVTEHTGRRLAVSALLTAAATAAIAAPADAAKTYKVNAAGKVKLTKREPATKKIEQKGTVTGTPFGTGTLTLRSRLSGRQMLEFSVRLVTRNGVVTGSGTAKLKASGSQANYTGTMRITGGSKRYRSIARTSIRVSGVGDSAARTTTVRFSGSVRY